ncbi:hypothetical protein ACFLYG_02900 [Chloroflexota bacterium]
MYKIVNSGIDSLVLGFSIEKYLDSDSFADLEDSKLLAGDKMFNSKGSPVSWYRVDFIVQPRGARGYEWILRNDDVIVCIAREAKGGSVVPEVYVTFSAPYLWSHGSTAAVNLFKRWLGKWALFTEDKVSRYDLCLDIEMTTPMIDLHKEIVTRAKHKGYYLKDLSGYMRGLHDSGYEFGKSDLVGRFYDKTLEIASSKKYWFREIWSANGWDGVTPVTRVEFQMRRNFIKLFQVNGYDDLETAVGSMWRYCTGDWLRVCKPPKGKKNNRQHLLPAQEWWVVVQQSKCLFGEDVGLTRFKLKKPRYDALMAQGEGVLSSALALRASAVGISEALYSFRQEIDVWLKNDLRDVAVSKIAGVSNMDKPDTHLVDEAIRLGAELIDVEFNQ